MLSMCLAVMYTGGGYYYYCICVYLVPYFGSDILAVSRHGNTPVALEANEKREFINCTMGSPVASGDTMILL